MMSIPTPTCWILRATRVGSEALRSLASLALLFLTTSILGLGGENAATGSLRLAIEDLTRTFPTRYAGGLEYLKRLESLRSDEEFLALQREALLANPLVHRQSILFVSRAPFVNTHGPDETMYQSNEANVAGAFRGGGALKVLDVATGQVRTILALANGIARDPVLRFDGQRIVFSMRRDTADNYHLYEIATDGTGLRQLTFAPAISDLYPVYLPNGQILFSSTREAKYIQCQRHLMPNLFVMDGDGANIHQIGHNTLFEGRGSLLPDGRVLYSRWEYVDKHFSSAYGLWTSNPDGTAQSLFYGGLAWQPGAILDGRAIPGSRRVVCVFGSVHDLEWGAMVVVDPDRGNDGPATIVHSWPSNIATYLKQWNTLGRAKEYDSFIGVPVKYQNPWPLSEKYFLCSRMLAANNNEMALFLVDVFNNETLVHAEAPGCFQPVLMLPQQRPPVIPSRTKPAAAEGVFVVYDVYRGAGMEAVARGTVKRIRVVEAPAKLTYPANNIGDWTAPGDAEAHHPTAVAWNQYNVKRVLGTVPVESDGSAHFVVPAGRFVYFQLLDERGRMIHSMRSGTTLQPGEIQSCVGCHDYRSAPPSSIPPKAVQRPPDRMVPNEKNFSYAAEVQPVLDRHCVRCHDYGVPAGRKLVLSGDRGVVYNASYVALMARSPAVWSRADAKPLVSTIGSGPVPVVPPLAWGSTRSRLVDLLIGGHEDVKLSAEELHRIVTWIDLNAPFYGDYQDGFSRNTYGRSPLAHRDLLRLGQLSGCWNSVTDYSGGKLTHTMASGEMPVNFTRPEFSACLQPEAPWYADALALIRVGQHQLARPALSMEDQQRLDAHALQQEREHRIRQAMSRNEKLYDEGRP